MQHSDCSLLCGQVATSASVTEGQRRDASSAYVAKAKLPPRGSLTGARGSPGSSRSAGRAWLLASHSRERIGIRSEHHVSIAYCHVACDLRRQGLIQMSTDGWLDSSISKIYIRQHEDGSNVCYNNGDAGLSFDSE